MHAENYPESAKNVPPIWSRFRQPFTLWAIALVCLIAVGSGISRSFLPQLPNELIKRFDRAASSVTSNCAAQNQALFNTQLVELARLTREGSITHDECEAMLDEIELLLFEVNMSGGLVQHWLADSTLADEEAKSIGNTYRRYAKAIATGVVEQPTAVAIEELVVEYSPTGKRRVRQTIDDDVLRELALQMDCVADAAGVSKRVERIDIDARLTAIFDRTYLQK